jgi:hypothetical protein
MPRKQSSSAKSKKQGSSTAGRSKSESGSHATSNATTDHDQIREWAEERGGIPARVRETGGPDDPGIIRIEFPDAPNSRDDKLEEISWDEFFEKFDEQGLALVYQDRLASGEKSNFYKLVKRENAKSASSGR